MTNETKLVNFRRPTTDQFSVAVDMIDHFHPAGKPNGPFTNVSLMPI